MTRLLALSLALALFAVACGGSSDDGNAFGVPECSEFVDGLPVPEYSLTEADDGGPGASCFDTAADSLVLSGVWDCDDGTSFVGRDDGYYLSGVGTWRDLPDGDEIRQVAFWGPAWVVRPECA